MVLAYVKASAASRAWNLCGIKPLQSHQTETKLTFMKLSLRHLLMAGIAVTLCAASAKAAEPIVVIETDMSAEEQALLESVLGEVDAPARSLAQARRRVEAAAQSARSVMRSLGYYDADIRAEVIETRAEAKDFSETIDEVVRRPPQAVLYVTTGPQFTYGDLDIEYKGGAPAPDVTLNKELKLETGQPAKAAPVVAAELRLINSLQAQGYPDAKALPRKAVVDHDTKRMNITYVIETGRRTRFGKIRQTGTAYLTKGFPKMVAPFDDGEIYSARKINRLAARVSGTGVFDSAVATLSDDGTENPDGTVTRDVILKVDQGDKNTISGGVGVSTADGSGAEITYERRNFIGYAQTLRVNARAKTNEIGAGLTYNIPYAWRDDRELDFKADMARLDTEAFEGERALIGALISQKLSRKFRVGLGLGLEASRFDQDGVETTAYLAEGLGRGVLDTRDNILNPVKGVNIEGAIVPTYNFGDQSGTFTTLSLNGSTYKRVSDKFVLAGRLGTGTILSKSFETVPRNRRFYAGGGGSVRGFEYQSISPRVVTTDVNSDGEAVMNIERIGGRTLLEGSAEIRYKGDGPIGYVGFIDAGTVSREQASGLDDVRYGAGVGVRYYTSFAPLRADVAIPLNPRAGDADFQIYISIGQAF